ncbi:MAG: hypothetical protein ACI837_002494 [Crocinitomicaceae bacterium]|jgi:hypothetical protein
MTSDLYANLREQLNLLKWPDVYLFKFIVPNELELVARVTAMFDDGTDLVYRASKNDKYMSISVKELMLNVDSIIEKYKVAHEIEGLIAL